MSFCDRLAIPESLVGADVARSKSLDSMSDFEEDIVILRNFSFISNIADDVRTWEMHRLVQDATQVWLEDHRRLDEVCERFVQCLDTSFPIGWFENWSVCRTFFPHASTYWSQGRWEEAEQLEVKVIKTSSASLEADHPSTLNSIANLISKNPATLLPLL